MPTRETIRLLAKAKADRYISADGSPPSAPTVDNSRASRAVKLRAALQTARAAIPKGKPGAMARQALTEIADAIDTAFPIECAPKRRVRAV